MRPRIVGSVKDLPKIQDVRWFPYSKTFFYGLAWGAAATGSLNQIVINNLGIRYLKLSSVITVPRTYVTATSALWTSPVEYYCNIWGNIQVVTESRLLTPTTGNFVDATLPLVNGMNDFHDDPVIINLDGTFGTGTLNLACSAFTTAAPGIGYDHYCVWFLHGWYSN